MNSKPFKHFDKLSTFNSKKISAISDDTAYYNNGIAVFGDPDILWNDICFIRDEKLIWTHGEFYNDGSNAELDNKITEIEEQLEGTSNMLVVNTSIIMDMFNDLSDLTPEEINYILE